MSLSKALLASDLWSCGAFIWAATFEAAAFFGFCYLYPVAFACDVVFYPIELWLGPYTTRYLRNRVALICWGLQSYSFIISCFREASVLEGNTADSAWCAILCVSANPITLMYNAAMAANFFWTCVTRLVWIIISVVLRTASASPAWALVCLLASLHEWLRLDGKSDEKLVQQPT
jgi:hypothetical protein